MGSRTVYNMRQTLIQRNRRTLLHTSPKLSTTPSYEESQKKKKQSHVKNKMIEKGSFESWTTMDGDDSTYTVMGFDPNLMLPDEDVYKPKTKAMNKTKGLESFMHPSEEEEVDKVAGRGDEH